MAFGSLNHKNIQFDKSKLVFLYINLIKHRHSYIRYNGSEMYPLIYLISYIFTAHCFYTFPYNNKI